MPIRSAFLRFLLGVVLVVLAAWFGFAITEATMGTYGATAAEQAEVLPGDESMPDAPIRWRHAITINAKPEAVWPWIIQMGDDRAAFYSYTFIERMVDPRPGIYVNASSIHPEWQNPGVGRSIIATQLSLAQIEPGKYMLATNDAGVMGWTWLWHITPTADGRTRLAVHMQLLPPPGMDNPVLMHVVGLGAFIMERNMMTGLKARAEGIGEPGWIEPLEIGLWFAALLAGLAAAVRWVARGSWLALAVGLAAVAALFVLTFLQPAVWLRALIDLALIGGCAWVFRPAGEAAVVSGKTQLNAQI